MNGGRCIDEVNNYKCQCPDGFSGTLCQDSITACLDGLCLKGCDRSPCRYTNYAFLLIMSHMVVCSIRFVQCEGKRGS